MSPRVPEISALTRVPQSEPICHAAKREQATLGLYGTYESLQQFAHILLDGQLLRRGKKLNDELVKTVGEFRKEPMLGCMPTRVLRGGAGVRVDLGLCV